MMGEHVVTGRRSGACAEKSPSARADEHVPQSKTVSR
jgi:hypothetical protein